MAGRVQAIVVSGQRPDLEPGQLRRPQRRGKADQDQRAITPSGQIVGDHLDRGAQQIEHQGGLFAQRPAVRPADAGEGGGHQRRRGRRRIAGQQMQIAQRGVAQPQGVDGQAPARLGREKRGDGLGRGRGWDLGMLRHTSR